MCGCIFKAKRLFLALLLCIGCTAVSNPASAVVCFLPDAEGCGDNGINYTPVICDGTNNFTQDLCNTTADKYSSKERHYFCVEEGTGCYVLDSTPCFESIDYDDCPGCLNSPKDEQYNCITTIQGFTRHVCSDKGISSEERDSRTQYLCREKKYKQEGCDTFDLSEAEKNEKEATGDYICSECIKDMYTSDYDGNWNRTGDGDTVYSCRGKVACNQTESDCTADQKFVADGTTDEYQQACGVCQDKVPCTKVASDCGSNEKFIADGTTDDYDHTCGKCETKIKCSKVASDCTGEQTFVKDGTTDDYNNECGTCKEPDKKTCAQLDLKTASECNSATQKFNSTRTDDYGTECGNCVAKKTCNNLGYKAESECKTSNQKFSAASPAVKDDYGTVCGSCGNKKTCKDMGYKTAAEASANERFNGNNITDDYNTPCGTLELKKCSDINATYKIAGNCSADETFAGNGTKGKDGDCGKCNLKTCAGITSGSTTKNKCTEACYTGFNPNGKTGSDGACGKCAAQCPSGYTKDLSSCGTKDGYVLTHKAASCTHSVVCGKCEECKLNSCSGYTYTTLSDYANSDSCDLGCNQGKKYRCKSGYTYSNGKCVIVPITITINYSLTIGYSGGTPGAGTGWLDMVFNVSSASDAKAHNVLLTFNPMDGAEVTNCTISYPLTIGSNSKTKVQCGQHYSMMNTPELTNVMIDNTNVVSAVRLDQLSKVSVKNDKYIIKFVKKTQEKCTPTCTSETNCQYGSKTKSDGCGGTCTICYPACKPGYWYGQSNAKLNCYVRPITGYLKQTENPNCLKCICNGSQRDPATGRLMPCAYI